MLSSSKYLISKIFLSQTSALRRSAMTNTAQGLKHLTQDEAIKLDKELFEEYEFSLDQLMELAGLSVATAIARTYPLDKYNKPIICCGPGNNGGDGLVCARHLKLFGYDPHIICPKPGRFALYKNLLHQCDKFGIVMNEMSEDQSQFNRMGNLVVDAVFGFSFKPPNYNQDFSRLLKLMHTSSTEMPLVSIDIPSGWHVERGYSDHEELQASIEPHLRIPALQPDCLISLTAPKICAKSFTGSHHYLGGRFCPEELQRKYELNLPCYPGLDCVVRLN